MNDILTISGDIGSGKSAVAKSLQAALGYDVIGTGSIQREIAKKRGITTLELNLASIHDPSVDEEIDNFVINLGKERDKVIVDSRLAWHFIPNSFKAFLLVDPIIGAERVFGAKRAEEENPTVATTLTNNRLRRKLEAERFKSLYDIDFLNLDNYQAVIDTSYSPPEIIAAKLTELHGMAEGRGEFARLWLNPKRLIPTRPAAHYANERLEEIETAIAQSGFDYSQSIEVVAAGDFFYLADGHKRALAAHRNQIDLVPCRLAKSGDTPMPAGLQDWEALLGFSMTQHPPLNSTPGPTGSSQD